MNQEIKQSDVAGPRSAKLPLGAIDWRIWFLGLGLGGCAGLGLLVGAWSILVDSSAWPGIIAVFIALTHSTWLLFLWSRRTAMPATFAVRSSYLLGAAGLASLALLMNAVDTQIPAPSSLFSLAIMNFIMAFLMPLQVSSQLSGRAPS